MRFPKLLLLALVAFVTTASALPPVSHYSSWVDNTQNIPVPFSSIYWYYKQDVTGLIIEGWCAGSTDWGSTGCAQASLTKRVTPDNFTLRLQGIVGTNVLSGTLFLNVSYNGTINVTTWYNIASATGRKIVLEKKNATGTFVLNSSAGTGAWAYFENNNARVYPGDLIYLYPYANAGLSTTEDMSLGLTRFYTSPVNSMYVSAFDEVNQTPQKTTMIISNASNATTYGPALTFSLLFSEIPTGNITITLRNSSCLSTGVLPRNYYATTASGSVLVTGYLLCDGDGSSPLNQIFTVKDYLGNLVSGAEITAQRFIGSGYTNVSSTLSAAGSANLYLDATIGYQLVVLTPNFPPFTTNVMPSVNVMTLTLGISNVPVYGQDGQVSGNCTMSAPTTLFCTANDSTHQAAYITNKVAQASGTGWLDTCANVVTGSNASFTCTNANFSSALIKWQSVGWNNDGSTIVMDQGMFDFRSRAINWGTSGYIIAIMFSLVMFAVGSWNPVVSMFLTSLTLIFLSIPQIGILNWSFMGVGSILLVAAILIWKSRA